MPSAKTQKTAPRTRQIAAKEVKAARPKSMPSQEQIARRAYEIWEAEGRPAGREQHHWSRAEGELRART